MKQLFIVALCLFVMACQPVTEEGAGAETEDLTPEPQDVVETSVEIAEPVEVDPSTVDESEVDDEVPVEAESLSTEETLTEEDLDALEEELNGLEFDDLEGFSE